MYFNWSQDDVKLSKWQTGHKATQLFEHNRLAKPLVTLRVSLFQYLAHRSARLSMFDRQVFMFVFSFTPVTPMRQRVFSYMSLEFIRYCFHTCSLIWSDEYLIQASGCSTLHCAVNCSRLFIFEEFFVTHFCSSFFLSFVFWIPWLFQFIFPGWCCSFQFLFPRWCCSFQLLYQFPFPSVITIFSSSWILELLTQKI